VLVVLQTYALKKSKTLKDWPLEVGNCFIAIMKYCVKLISKFAILILFVCPTDFVTFIFMLVNP
jgi:hypothetical protein